MKLEEQLDLELEKDRLLQDSYPQEITQEASLKVDLYYSHVTGKQITRNEKLKEINERLNDLKN